MTLLAVAFGAASALLFVGITGEARGGSGLVGYVSRRSRFLRGRVQRRRDAQREAWPDAIAVLIAAVRSGAALPEACVALCDRGPIELRPGFIVFRDLYRATGDLSRALHAVTEDLADPIADRVVVALELAHDLGGPELVRILGTIASFVREEARIRREVNARWSWTTTAAKVAAAAPWIVLAIMSLRPEAARAYGSPAGTVVIAGGAVATVVGYRLMLRAGRLPEQGRLR